jgi:hypothetical protein
MGAAVKLQRRVVRDDRIGRESARQEKRVDLEGFREGAAGHDRVESAPDVQEVSRAQVLPEKRGREILEPEQMASRCRWYCRSSLQSD